MQQSYKNTRWPSHFRRAPRAKISPSRIASQRKGMVMAPNKTPTDNDYDIVIIGSGVGGGAVALQLAGSDARVLVLERGPALPREAQNWDDGPVPVSRA
jgi:heterodisulfide reductase subunit A-like polyferredoxin